MNEEPSIRKLSMEDLQRKSLEEAKASQKTPIVVVLENIRSAYNVGSVFRTADAFLLEAIYICGYTAVPPHKEIKKTALGAEESVQWKHYAEVNEAISDLKMQGYKLYAVEQAEHSFPLQQVSYEGEKLAVVFGNEVSGVDVNTIAQCDGCIEIPQFGMKHSLNVSVAAGVVLWELVRKGMQKASS